MSNILYCALTFLLVVNVAVYSFPDGAPTCFTGGSAPRDLHILPARNPQSGEISLQGFQVFIDDVEVVQGTISRFEAKLDHVIRVQSSTGVEFKGALVLLSKVDVDVSTGLSVKADSVDYQLAPVCLETFTAGITHIGRNVKQVFESTLRLDKGIKNLQLDVNVVLQNNITGSLFYWSKFEVESFGNAPPKCGILGLRIWCPLKACGIVGRLLRICPTP